MGSSLWQLVKNGEKEDKTIDYITFAAFAEIMERTRGNRATTKIMRVPLILLTLICLVAACASQKRPIAYPNDHLREVGQGAAQADIDACLRLADEHQVVADASGTAVKETTTDTATGMATGAATGALTGGGIGAAVGVLSAGIRGATRGFTTPREPDAAFQSFVEQCLNEKGYKLVGWQ